MTMLPGSRCTYSIVTAVPQRALNLINCDHFFLPLRSAQVSAETLASFTTWPTFAVRWAQACALGAGTVLGSGSGSAGSNGAGSGGRGGVPGSGSAGA